MKNKIFNKVRHMKKSYLRKENDLSTYIAETGEGMKNNMTSDGHGIANIGGRNKPACKSELPRIHRNMASIFSMGLALLGFLVIGLSTTSSTAFAGFPNLLGSHASNRSSQPSISFHKRQIPTTGKRRRRVKSVCIPTRRSDKSVISRQKRKRRVLPT
jgi:hypothetical protein